VNWRSASSISACHYARWLMREHPPTLDEWLVAKNEAEHDP